MPRARSAWALLALALALGGCGGARYADAPSPPAPIVVGAAITRTGVSLDRSHLGAGLVKVVVTNLTGASQQLILRSAGGGFQQQTAPINPADTAELRAELGAGTYTVGVRGPGLKPAMLAVGAARASSQGQLLLP